MGTIKKSKNGFDAEERRRMGEMVKRMIDKVQQYMTSLHMIEKNDRIVIGVSGGADSVALLLVLLGIREKYALELFVVHINHGIRADASQDAEYVKEICDMWNLPFYMYEADIIRMAKEEGKTEEEMGRWYRYRCFDEVMRVVDAKKLAVAHHMDDQAETVLFHLIRGSRIAGMEGMRPVTDFWYGTHEKGMGQRKIIRPLLSCRKYELKEWLCKQNIRWMEDSTNTSNEYSRNRIRNQILPVMEEMNGQAIKHISEFAQEMTGYREFFEKTVANYKEKETIRVEEGHYETNRQHLLQQDVVFAKAVIYEMIFLACGKKKDISSVHVQDVYDLLGNQSGKKVSLPYRMEAEVSYEKLIIRKRLEETEDESEYEMFLSPAMILDAADKEISFSLPNGAELIMRLYVKNQCAETEWNTLVNEVGNSKNNYTKFFEYDRIKDTLCVRGTQKEDYFIMNQEGARKKVSRYFIDAKIPGIQRRELLVVAKGAEVLWIIGHRRCEEYKVSAESKMLLQLTYKGD